MKQTINGWTIRAIYDRQSYVDRYTVYVKHPDSPTGTESTECIGMSKAPPHPQRFSQWGTGRIGKHNGKKIAFTDLPKNIQKHVFCRLQDN